MQTAADLFLVLTQNLVFHHLLGFPSIAETNREDNSLIINGIFTMIFCIINAVCITFLRSYFTFLPENLLFPITSILISSLAAVILWLIIQFIFKKHKKQINQYIINAAFSSAVLGAALITTDYTHEVAIALKHGFRLGVGYCVACLLLQMAAPALSSEKLPKAVQGWRSLYLYAGILSLAVACLK